MGRMPAGSVFSYGLCSECTDLTELLQNPFKVGNLDNRLIAFRSNVVTHLIYNHLLYGVFCVVSIFLEQANRGSLRCRFALDNNQGSLVGIW